MILLVQLPSQVNNSDTEAGAGLSLSLSEEAPVDYD